MEKRIQLMDSYINLLYEYCNTYDSEAISQVLMTAAAHKIEMKDVYTALNVIPRQEYEKRISFNSIKNSSDLDEVVLKIDKKIYEITIEDLRERELFSVSEETFLKIKLLDVKHLERKDYPTAIREELLQFSLLCENDKKNIVKLIVQVDERYVDKIKLEGWCIIKGHYVTYKDFKYFVMEPYNEKEIENNHSTRVIQEWEENFDKILDEIEGKANGIVDCNSNVIGEVLLSEPGGGKTTLVLNKALGYCEKYLGCEKASKLNLQFPILIFTREIKKEQLYDDGVVSLKSVIIAAMDSIFKRDERYSETFASQLYDYLVDKKINVVLIIDGFEELVKLDINQEGTVESRDDGVRLLDLLENTYKENKLTISYLIISSRYKEYGYQRLKDFVRKHNVDEYFICELRYDEDRIIEFAKKWFGVFKKINPLIDVDKETERFGKIYRDNPSIKNIINTPIELTSLIMLYITSYSLPTDISILYRNVIEVWLTFNVIKADFDNFSLEDIMMELSRVALYMAYTQDEKIRISKENLKAVINNTKINFQRYYRNSSYWNEPTEKIINYIVRRNIMVENDGKYEFKHRQYQAFLCANCIIGNYIARGDNDIIGETRKLDRMMYFMKHLDACDDFWDQILIFSAFMNIDLHDSIISELLKRTQDDENSNYYIGILIQLVNSQGFWFETSELEMIYDELFRNPNRWKLITGYDNKTEIRRMLINGRKENNNAFLRKGLIKYNELQKLEKNHKIKEGLAREFKYQFKALFFYVIWRCPVNYELLPEIFKTFFVDEISYDIMSEVYSKYKEGYEEEIIDEIRKVGEGFNQERDADNPNDYMIISFILGYIDDNHPIENALRYFRKGDMNSRLIALDIMFLAAWIIYSKKSEKYGYNIDENMYKGSLKECLKYIVDGMISEDGKVDRDFKSAYREWSIANYTLSKLYEPDDRDWYTDEVFYQYARACSEKVEVWSDERNRLDYDFEVVASFPFNKDYNYNVCKDMWSEQVICEIERINQTITDPEIALCTFKLLIFSGYIPYEEISIRYTYMKSRIKGMIERAGLKDFFDAYEIQLKELGLLDDSMDEIIHSLL